MKTNVCVIFGGRSTEHEVSIISANQAMHACDKEKYNVIPLYISKKGVMYSGDALLDITNYKNLSSLLEKCEKVVLYNDGNGVVMDRIKKPLFGGKKPVTIDIAVPVVHGTNVEDGSIQGWLETLDLPYAGCDVTSSALGMDKVAMKDVLAARGIPVLPCKCFYNRQWFETKKSIVSEIETLGYPVIVKPANLGSSIGISVAKDKAELISSIDNAVAFAEKILVEHAITAIREINCSILGDFNTAKASVCEEPVSADGFLSYDKKYKEGAKGGSKGMASTKRIIPADLPDNITKRIQQYSVETFKALGCCGVARIDCMIDKDTDEIYVNEINTIPGSLAFYLWEKTNLSFQSLMDELISIALKRRREKSNLTFSFDTNLLELHGGVKGTKTNN
ncbi:MAG: D-alanine--D-alanine ligase family protein [Bacillota bacterium]|nr:D-alanine--D-alanine ligase family protein [Bacillota bacterium]